MLQITDLTVRIAGRTLLDQAAVTLPKSRKAGLVGPNGSGKTTLLRVIAGEIQPDGGAVTVPPRWRVGGVAQEAPGGPESLLDTVLAADRERTALLAEADTANDPARIAEIHTRLADIQAESAPARAASVLAGLGFDVEAQGRPCREFSGGMRMRVALAAVLFLQPDLLLLDEPTNHLDLEATLWLEGYLKGYPHTVLLVSHDRDLLNRAVDMTIAVEQAKLVAYGGGYDQFEQTRALRAQHQAALQTRQLAQRRHMQAFIDRFRYKASKARQAQSRIKALERMEPVVTLEAEHEVRFDFPAPEPMPPPLVVLDDVAAGYGDRVVLRRLGLRIDMDDRIALLGANGNGKSTLAKLLASRIAPLSGEVRRSPKLKVGYFAQHQLDELDPRLTALAQTRALMPQAPEEKVRAHLGRFGFPQARAETRIADMSGGEKARLTLALISREAPHILLLDEPTNHLDIASRDALVEALNAYEGAVVLITHDPHLIELTADRLWLVAEGRCLPYDGDLADYRRLLQEQRRAEQARAGGGERGPSRRDQRRSAAETRAALAPLRRRIRDAEQAIERLGREKAALEKRLADPDLYAGPAGRVTEAQIALHKIETRLAAAETDWLEAAEALEAEPEPAD